MFRRVMEREFEIVGEALKRIRDDEESIYDLILHAASIVGFRNRLAHEYDSIDDAVVWGIVSGHVPLLISEIESIL